MSKALRRAAEHVAGFFGGGSEEYERAYLPWDELVQGLVERFPEQYAPDEVVLESEWNDG